MVMTREEFVKEIESNPVGTKYILESEDSGSVYFSLHGCVVIFDLEMGISGEITIFKPELSMEVTLDFAIFADITQEHNGSYRFEFNNGLADAILRLTKAD